MLAEKKKIKIDKELLKERIKLLNVNLKKKDEVKKRKSAEIELEKKKKAKPVVSGGKKEKKKEAEGIVNYEVGILSKPNRKKIRSERFNQLVELLSLRVDARRQHVFPEQALVPYPKLQKKAKKRAKVTKTKRENDEEDDDEDDEDADEEDKEKDFEEVPDDYVTIKDAMPKHMKRVRKPTNMQNSLQLRRQLLKFFELGSPTEPGKGWVLGTITQLRLDKVRSNCEITFDGEGNGRDMLLKLDEYCSASCSASSFEAGQWFFIA